MANATITKDSLGNSGALKSLMTLLADGFIQAARTRGRILKYIRTQNETQAVAQLGDTARVLLASDSVAINDLSDGSDRVLDDTVGTSVDVVLNKHKIGAFSMTQIATALDGGRTLPMQVNSYINGLLNTIEADICALAHTGFTTNVVGAYDTALTEPNAIAAMEKLFNNNVPAGEPIHAFIKPGINSWAALVQLAGFREHQITGKESPIVSAQYGEGTFWHGATWQMSQNVKQVNSTPNAQISNFLFHRDALACAMKALPIPDTGAEAANFVDPESGIQFQILKQWNHTKLAEELVIHALYGCSVAKEKWGCLFKC
jgi:hypothetical protein